MKPPYGVGAAGRRAWVEAEATLRAIGEDPELCAGAMSRYASAVAQMAELERQWRELGRPSTTPAASTIVAHPLLVQINSARRQVGELSEALGLDPAARRKMSRRVTGGQPGATSAADRSAPSKRSLKAA